jgi:hypothetical protein
MSAEKKRSSEKHFLETESGYKQLMKAVKNDVPSEETLAAIRDYNIRTGKLNVSKFSEEIPGTAAYYLGFLLDAEQKSIEDLAGELGVTVLDLKHLQREIIPIQEKSLFEICGSFVDKHPQFSLRSLYSTLKRAIVLNEMTSSETSLKKAARKRPPKK